MDWFHSTVISKESSILYRIPNSNSAWCSAMKSSSDCTERRIQQQKHLSNQYSIHLQIVLKIIIKQSYVFQCNNPKSRFPWTDCSNIIPLLPTREQTNRTDKPGQTNLASFSIRFSVVCSVLVGILWCPAVFCSVLQFSDLPIYISCW